MLEYMAFEGVILMQGKLIISSFDEEEDIFRTDVICGMV